MFVFSLFWVFCELFEKVRLLGGSCVQSLNWIFQIGCQNAVLSTVSRFVTGRESFFGKGKKSFVFGCALMRWSCSVARQASGSLYDYEGW